MNGPGVIKGGKTEVDSDGDGMPDKWEYYYGLNPYSNSDQNGDLDSDGYTNVEEYLNKTDPGKGDGIISDRTYYILIRHSQKALDIKDRSVAEGTLVVQNTQQKVSRQIWHVTSVDENYYSIINDSSNLCLDLKDQSVSDSTLIVQSAYIGDFSQQWHIEFLGEGYYSITNRQSGKSPEVEAASTDDGIPLIQRYFVDSTNQQFMLVPSDLYYSKPVVFITRLAPTYK